MPATASPTIEGTPGPGKEERLAVIIPAYKGAHLAETLASFAAQTDQRFRVYIGDDASPENLAAIVAPFRGRLDLVYHRFAANLGGTSLTRHWDRAIALSAERWIWLFSDDDFVAPDCVASFWSERARRPHAAGLLRFQCVFVDDNSRPRAGTPLFRYPPHQTWEEHVHGPANPRELYVTIVQNVIFPRELYQRHQGFYDYPLGLWSDYITWTRFSREEGFTTLPAGEVFYRIHATSIGGGIFSNNGDRCELLRSGGRMFADFRTLFAAEGKRSPQLEFLLWFARMFQYSARPLSKAERAAAAEALRLGWPGWVGVREVIFWSRAGRPLLKNQRWLVALVRVFRGRSAAPVAPRAASQLHRS